MINNDFNICIILYQRMENNNLLMIILAFVVGFMLPGMMNNMCGVRLIEGKARPYVNQEADAATAPITCSNCEDCLNELCPWIKDNNPGGVQKCSNLLDTQVQENNLNISTHCTGGNTIATYLQDATTASAAAVDNEWFGLNSNMLALLE